MNNKFVDKNNKALNKGDYISFEGDKAKLLYACDIGGSEGLGVNASRHYVGSELYPLTAFPCETLADGTTRMTTGEKFKLAIFDGEAIQTACRYGHNGHYYAWLYPTKEKIDKLIAKYGFDQICDGTLWLQS